MRSTFFFTTWKRTFFEKTSALFMQGPPNGTRSVKGTKGGSKAVIGSSGYFIFKGRCCVVVKNDVGSLLYFSNKMGC